MVAKYQGEVTAGLFLLYYRDTVISGWAGSMDEHLDLCPNNLLYWTAIKNACINGFRLFDFGRSVSSSGVSKFKKAWAASEKPLCYQYYLTRGRVPNTSQKSADRNRFASLWRHIPLVVANSVGPKLRAHFP